ncbi:MAG TPA: hypothetical protein VEU33_50595, partial [Archangium sp.]|nr:hypothetical protein [Archangium sp.]
MHAHTRFTTWSILALVTSTGCVSFTPSIHPQDKPSSRDAYVYGRFRLVNTINTMYDTHGSMGLELECENNHKTYTIGFSMDEPIQVINIPGGDTCSWMRITFTDSIGAWAGSNSLSSKELRRAIRYESGKAYYLGDFEASFGFADSKTLRWEITDVADNFQGTTQEMKSRFRNLSAI